MPHPEAAPCQHHPRAAARRSWLLLLVLCGILLTPGVRSRAQTDAGAEPAIRAVLAAQVAAWNRGDIPGFMAGYENSPDTTFVGKNVTHGWADVLEHYREHYTGRDLMGTLTFSNLAVRPLDANVAVVTGSFHLQRTAGNRDGDSGIFSLVFRKGADGWKIVLDHTS